MTVIAAYMSNGIAVVHGYVDMSIIIEYGYECGVCFSTERDMPEDNVTSVRLEYVTEDKFEVSISGLDPDTLYYCAPYYCVGELVFYGEVVEISNNTGIMGLSGWGVSGTNNDWGDASPDSPMMSLGDICVAYEVDFNQESNRFKIRYGDNRDSNYGATIERTRIAADSSIAMTVNGYDIYIDDGIYDIWSAIEKEVLNVVYAGTPPEL